MLLLLVIALNAQYYVKHNGKYVVHYGNFVKGAPASYQGSSEFTTLYEWDFEDMPYGLSTKTHWRDYMVEDDVAGLDWAEDTIVDATIDGVTSKAVKIMNYSGDVQQSMQYFTYFDEAHTGLDKLCFSYHVRFDAGFEAVSDNGKLPGILVNGDAYETQQDCPADSANGSTIGYLYKGGLQFSDYNWNHNYPTITGCPWRLGEVEPSGLYMAPGTWYEITEYLVMNTPDVSDGIQEIYVNGDMIFQTDTMKWRQNEFHHFDGLRFTFFQSAPSTSKTSSWTTDNFIVWEPTDDAIYDAGTTHATNYIMESPNTLTNRDHYYDHLGTTDGTYSTPSYPSATSPGHHEAWRFTGTTDVEITFAGALGSSDYLIVIDGSTVDDSYVYVIEGYDADISDEFDGGGATYRSSGTDVIVWTVNSEDTGFTKIQMTVDIDPDYKTAGIGNSQVNGSDEAFDLLGEEAGYSMINLAVAGDKIEDQQDDWNAEVKISSAEKTALTHVIIAVGANNAITGTPDSATIVNKYKSLLTDINADISGSCEVIMFTMIHCLGHVDVTQSDMDVLKAVNTWIETVPTGVDIVSTENTTEMSDGDYLDAAYERDPPDDDGLHINAAGTAVFLQNIIDEIN